MGSAFFPLDEELGLLSGGVTPRAEETLVRLSSWMPYESARELLEEMLEMITRDKGITHGPGTL